MSFHFLRRSSARFFFYAAMAATTLGSCGTVFAQRPDVLIDDFEGDAYNGWIASGTAFGSGPAHGTLPNQMHVDGFEGKGYASSFHGADPSIGKLISKPIAIERPYINFLIGGGAFPNQTCIRMRVGDRTVRESVGPNRNSGGSERLQWSGWEVAEFVGQQATIEIIDDHVGGWGHISIDQIVQSDQFKGPKWVERSLVLSSRYLQLPVSNTAPLIKLEVFKGKERVRQYDIQLATGESTPSFYAPIDMSGLEGPIRIGTVSSNEKDTLAALEKITASASYYDEKQTAQETRPSFHFASKTGWLNDPNGLVYFNGLWHLYYQHNPVGWGWGNMHWGHATSPDLIRWTEYDDVFRPWVQLRGAAFSGSAVVDHRNTTGWGVDGKPVLVAALTDTDAGESIAYSQDGFKWTLFDGNPVVKHPGRDPRLFWYKPTKRWIMAVYDEADGSQNITFHSSPDLKTWTRESRIDGYFECPDIFELPVGNSRETKWVLSAADGKYAIGHFDGHAFKPEHDGKHQLWFGNFYAAQSFSNAPEGRRIQIGWGQGIEFPGQRFNQQMCVPVELSLKETKDGVRMFAEPVQELARFRKPIEPVSPTSITKSEGGTSKTELAIPCRDAEVQMRWNWKSSGRLIVRIRGEEIHVDVDKKQCLVGGINIPIAFDDQQLDLQILVDAGSMEVFVNGGEHAISKRLSPSNDNLKIDIENTGNLDCKRLSAYCIGVAAGSSKP